MHIEQNVGNISAPLQSPAVDLCSVNSAMTRSRSLNSPLVSGATGTCCQHLDHPASTRNKRRHSGMGAIKELLKLSGLKSYRNPYSESLPIFNPWQHASNLTTHSGLSNNCATHLFNFKTVFTDMLLFNSTFNNF